MPFESKLTFEAECEDCLRKETKIFYGDEFGISEEVCTEVVEFRFDLEVNYGWELERVSYEEHKFYCPDCKRKRAVA